MPRGHDRDPIYLLSIHMRLLGQFFFEFSQKKIVMRKKIVAPCLGVIMIAFFPRKNSEVFFAQKACINTERVPPGHPIILLKSNEFNMATVSVKRSIYLSYIATK